MLLRFNRSASTPASRENSQSAKIRSINALPMTAAVESPPTKSWANKANPTARE